MASRQERAEFLIDIDGKKAGEVMDNLKKKAEQLGKAYDDARAAGDKNTMEKAARELKNVEKDMDKLALATTNYNKVLNNLSTASLKELQKAQGQIKAELGGIKRGTDEWVAKNGQLQAVTAEIRKVKAEYNGLNNEIDKTKIKTEGMGNASGGMFGKLADGFSRFSGLVLGIIGSITGLVFSVRQIIQVFNDFQEKVDELASITGLSGKKLEDLSEAAKRMSVSWSEGSIRIKQSAGDIVQSFAKVGSQRAELLKNSQSLKMVTEDAIILSEAAKSKLDPATMALTNTLNQFDLAATQSRRVINALAAGSLEGAGSIPYLSQAIEKAGTRMNLLGVSVEETVALVETVAPKFADAATAGNSFDKLFEMLKAKGIGVKDGMFNVKLALDQLEAKFQSGQTATQLFGSEHAKLAEVLVLNKKEYERLEKAVTGTNTAIEQATINTSNNNAIIAQAKNQIELYAITLGEKLSPIMAQSFKLTTQVMKVLADLVENPKPVEPLVNSFISVYNVFKNLFDIIGKLIKSLGFAGEKFDWINTIAIILSNTLSTATFATRALIFMFTKFYEVLTWVNEKTQIMSIYFELLSGNFENVYKRVSKISPLLADAFWAVSTPIRFIITNIIDLLRYLNILEEKAKTISMPTMQGSYTDKQKDTTPQSIFGKQKSLKNDNAKANPLDIYLPDSDKEEKKKIITSATTSGGGDDKDAQKRIDDERRVIDEITKMNIAAIDDKHKRDIAEAGNWLNIEMQKINDFKVAETLKEEMRVLVRNAYTNKLDAIEKERADKQLETARKLNDFILKENEKLITDKKQLLEIDINQIKAKYDEQIKIAREAGLTEKITELEQLKDNEIAKLKIDYKRKEEEAKIAVIKEYAPKSTELFEIELEKLKEAYDKDLKNYADNQEMKDLITKGYNEKRDKMISDFANAEENSTAAKLKNINKLESESLDKIAQLKADGLLTEQAYETARTNILIKAIQERMVLYQQEIEAANAIIKEGTNFFAAQKEQETQTQEFAFNAKTEALNTAKENELAEFEDIEARKSATERYYARLEAAAQARDDKAELARLKQEKEKQMAVFSDAENKKKGIEDKYKALEQQATEENEAKKKEIRKRYAEIEFIAKIAEIATNTAVAITKAVAQLGPIAGGIASGFIIATGATQAAIAKEQLDNIRSLADGGYTGEGIDKTDKTGKRVAGVVHANEYVVSEEALNNPQIASAVSMIEEARQNDALNSFNFPEGINTFADGGYTSDTFKTGTTNSNTEKADIERLKMKKEEEISIISEAENKKKNIEDKYKTDEIQSTEENEKKKDEIRQKYAEIELKRKIAEINANTAVGITKLNAQYGGFGLALSGFLIKSREEQLAIVQTELDNIRSLAEGGYTGEGINKADDSGKRVAGIVHANEYVVSEQALANPQIASVVSLIEKARMQGALNSFNFPVALGSFATGGYTTTMTTPTTTPALSQADTSLLTELQTGIKTLNFILNQMVKEPIKAEISYFDFKKAEETIQDIEKAM